jgi:signal transduction histidine kinase
MADSNDVRILVVDDEAALMQALCDTLRERGFQTVGFTGGEPALSALKKQSFDLVLTDLMMPDMDGITLLREATEIDPNLVVVIMTGQASVDSAVEAMKSGALDYITKPFKLGAIMPVLDRALGVRRLRVENSDLAESLRKRTDELEAANNELEAFAYSVSHDLRAPLRAIASFSEIIREDHGEEFSEEATELLDRIDRNAQRMSALISDLLTFSRLSKKPFDRKVVDVRALVSEVVDEISKDRGERCISVHELPETVGDQLLLRQVFSNLLSNSFKFTSHRENPRIDVGWCGDDREHCFYVKDNGAGFDMQYAGKLFDVFQRLHSETEFEGTGVGLSIVRRLVQRHGGRIWAEGEVDRGASFYFTLPR